MLEDQVVYQHRPLIDPCWPLVDQFNNHPKWMVLLYICCAVFSSFPPYEAPGGWVGPWCWEGGWQCSRNLGIAVYHCIPLGGNGSETQRGWVGPREKGWGPFGQTRVSDIWVKKACCNAWPNPTRQFYGSQNYLRPYRCSERCFGWVYCRGSGMLLALTCCKKYCIQFRTTRKRYVINRWSF